MADPLDESDLDDPGESPPAWFVVLVLGGAVLLLSVAGVALWALWRAFW